MKRKSLLLLFILVLLVLAVACSSRSFDTRDLAEIQLSGADGYGSLVVLADQAKLAALLEEEASGLREHDEKGLQRLFQREAALNSLIFTADKLADLQNGDEVTIRGSYDEAMAKAAGIRFKNTKFIYKVEGLAQAQPIHVRNHVNLAFSGYNGHGQASILLTGDMEAYQSAFDFVFESGQTDLSNGDRVDLKVLPHTETLTDQGRIAYETRLSFRVEGLLPMTHVDLFEDLVLVFDGISDQGVLSIDTTRLPADWVEASESAEAPVTYLASPAWGLSNGDTVRVEATVDQEWFWDRGLSPGEREKTYQVQGLKEFPRNLDQVDLMPLFSKIDDWLQEDMALRVQRNYWNRDFRTGQAISLWDTHYDSGVVRLYYGYEQSDRANNFVAILYKVEVEGSCLEATPYQSSYQAGDRETASLYLLYVVDRIMYDRAEVDDFREINLRLHSDVELEAVALFKDQYGGEGRQIVQVEVPEEVAFKGASLFTGP